MGAACASRNDPSTLRSKAIDNQLKKITQAASKEVKVLLLGPGESGKSTVFKQMKIIQDARQSNPGFSDGEKASFLPAVHDNCVTQMRVLIEASFILKIPFEQQDAQQAAVKFMKNVDRELNEEVAQMIKVIWRDPGIVATYQKRGKAFQLNDTAYYFFENIDRICSPDYLPTVDDILRARVRSIGIEEAKFCFEELNFLMVDVGGQRSERRKWIHCFSHVTAVLFIAGLSGYSHPLREDQSQNTMTETLLLFDEVANSTYFGEDVVLILFLNKIDLFEEKLKLIPLKDCFPDYTGPDETEPALSYVRNKFEDLSPPSKKPVVHTTCALDTTNVRYVITVVRAKLLEVIMQETGLNL